MAYAEYTYAEARRFMSNARKPENGRPLQNNTRMYERPEGFGIQLHCTDVVTVLPGDRYALRTGGWRTVTTVNRIFIYAPVRGTLHTAGGDWWLRTRPSDDDPEPEYPHRTVPKPFHATDPGPEPVKDYTGCEAGVRHAIGHMTKVLVDPPGTNGTWSASREDDRPYFYDSERKAIDDAPTRARSVLAHIGAIEPTISGYWVVRPAVKVIDYGEEAHSYAHYGVGERAPHTVYEQCPHCAAFDKVHRAWADQMHGSYYSRRGGWELHTRMIEQHGSYEAWLDAWREDGREVRAGQQLWREWNERNQIPFREGIVVNADGHPVTREVKLYRSELARARRREREARRAEEFRQKIRRKRQRKLEKDPNYLGREIALGLHEIRSNMEACSA